MKAFLNYARVIKLNAGGFSVFAGVGERTREGNDLYKEMIEGVSLAELLNSYRRFHCRMDIAEVQAALYRAVLNSAESPRAVLAMCHVIAQLVCFLHSVLQTQLFNLGNALCFT